MSQPESISAFCASLFGWMGGLFAALGVVFWATGIPTTGGPSWFFVLVGGLLLLAGLGCRVKYRWETRRVERLKREGVSVLGRMQAVRHLVWMNWNTSTFVQVPGSCSPWVVLCAYDYQGQTYTVKSGLAWRKPAASGQRPRIYLDPKNPACAFVDLDTIRWEW